MASYAKAFHALNITRGYYLGRVVAPLVGGSLVVALVFLFAVNPLLPAFVRPFTPFVLGGFGILFAAMYPLVVADKRRTQINNTIPYFMTHLGALSTSNLSKPEIFRLLGERKEYGALADELKRIHHLVVNWNMALPQACRFVASSTPSQLLSDFLDRLAQAFETGQELESFLNNEQHVVMKEYANVYETAIYQVEQLKDMYSSLVMSGVFFAVFGIITPIITQVEPTRLLVGIVILFAFIEGVLFFLIKVRVPRDKVWHDLNIRTKERDRMVFLFAICLLTSIALFILLFTAFEWPLIMDLAVAATPLAVAGIYSDRAEQRVKRREDNYGAFIRSVGSAAEARGGSLREILKKVRTHNFGPLTVLVQNLFARLTWRLHDVLAWRHFAAESGSKVVASFNEMFVESVRAGGKPERVGGMINDNVVRMLGLRRSRYSTATTFRGLLLGLTAAMAFTLFIGLGILETLGGLFQDTPVNDSNPIRVDLAANTELIRGLLVMIMFLHALFGGMMLKMIDGGHPIGASLHFVLLLWVGALLALGSEKVIGGVFRSMG